MPLQKILILVWYVAYFDNTGVIPSLVKDRFFSYKNFPVIPNYFVFRICFGIDASVEILKSHQ